MSRTRTNSNRGVVETHRETTEIKVNSINTRAKASKSLIWSNKAVASKDNMRWRLELKTHPKGNIKAKEMAKQKTRIETKSKENESSTVSSMAERRDMSPEIV
jgi:hypothetical protein